MKPYPNPGRAAVLASWLIAASAAAATADAPRPKKAVTKAAASQDKPAAQQYIAVEAKDDAVLEVRNLWRGYNLTALAKAAEVARAGKGDFESSADYASRLAREHDQIVYGSISLNSRLLLVQADISKQSDYWTRGGAPIGYKYDADAQMLRICWSGIEFISGQLGRAVESIAVDHTNSTESVGQNALGVKIQIAHVEGEYINVASSVTANRCPLEIEADGPRAQELLSKSGVVLMGRLRAPFVEGSAEVSKATISSPTSRSISIHRLLFDADQLVLVDRQSRQVIARTSIPAR